MHDPRAKWPKVRLADVAQVINGGTPKSKVRDYWGGDVQWLTPKEMGGMASRHIGATERTISETGLAKSSARLVPPNSLILSTRAPIGHLAINKVEMAFNQGCRGIVPSANLDTGFLYYFLLANRQQLNDLGTGTTFKELSATNLKTFQLPLPALDEQKRIVAVLDQAFAALDRARDYTESNLASTRELLEQTREQLISSRQPGWKEESLANLITVKHGFAFKSRFFKNEGTYVLLTPGNFFERGGFRRRGEKQKYYHGDIPRGFILDKGDLLMAMTEQAPGLLGSCILVPESNRFLHNQRLGLIEPKNTADWHAAYFSQAFNLRAFRKALSDSCSGIKVRHTSPDKIRNVNVPVPPTVDAQKSIAEKMDRIVDTSAVLSEGYSTKLEEIEALRHSLLRQAFSGNLV